MIQARTMGTVGARPEGRVLIARIPKGAPIASAEQFADRHIGPSPDDVDRMLSALGVASLDDLLDQAVPASIRDGKPLEVEGALSEPEAIARLRALADRNQVFTSLIGQGYHGTHTPGVILRNVLENPAWYTAYTPYQPEISQGRLEALLNFQTMVCDLTGDGDHERLHARRGHRRRRGHDSGPALDPPPGQRLLRRRRVPPADHRRGRHPGRAAGHRRGGGRPRHRPVPHRRLRACCCSTPGPRASSATCGRSSTRCTRPAGWPSWPPTCWPAPCWSRRASWAPTPRSGRPSASACRWASADRTPGSSPPATSSAGPCPAASSGSRSTPPAAPPTGWRCRPASSTSAARRRRPTSAPPRCCWPSWPRCTPCTTGPTGCGRSPHGCAPLTTDLAARLREAGLDLRNDTWFDTLTVHVPGQAAEICERARQRRINLRRVDGDTVVAVARRDHDARRADRRHRGLRAQRRLDGVRRRRRPARGRAPHQRVPHPPRLPRAPVRDRDAALPAPPRRHGRGARPGDDPARLLHHEAERHHRDGAGDVARVRGHPPVRPGRPGRGLPRR